jgi:hypothetical protein
MAAATEQHCGGGGGDKEKDLLSAVVGDIRSYSGSDPLRPWLRYSLSLPLPIDRFPFSMQVA